MSANLVAGSKEEAAAWELIKFLEGEYVQTYRLETGASFPSNLNVNVNKLIDEKGDIPNVKNALLADAVGTVAGACLGTSTVTSYVESSAGVAAGARTGLSSVVTAGFFVLALLFTPLFALVPSCATAPALIFVGFLMMQSVTSIKFSEITDGIPAFITILVMPFGYSISKGIAFGMIAYVISKVAGRKAKEISPVTWILAAVFVFALAIKAI